MQKSNSCFDSRNYQDWWLHWAGKERKSEGDMHGKTKQN
jgi:hypothetical protein